MGDSGGSLDQNAHRKADSNSVHEICSGNEELIWRSLTLHSGREFVYILSMLWDKSKTEFKNSGPVNLMEEIPRQSSSQAVAWLLLAAFSQVYSENCE
jgi:hypothetical protein